MIHDAMADLAVLVLVHLLPILVLTARQMKQGKPSESVLRQC